MKVMNRMLMLFAACMLSGGAFAAVDGVIVSAAGSSSSPAAWKSMDSSYTGMYNGSIWKDALVPSGGGSITLSKAVTVYLTMLKDVEIGKVDIPVTDAKLYLMTNPFKLTGTNPELVVRNASTLTLNAAAPVSGTGVLKFRTSPAGYAYANGSGQFDIYNTFSGFSKLDLASGTIDARYSEAAPTVLTTGSVRLGGGIFSYVASADGEQTGSIATGDGATFTFAPGYGKLRVTLSGNATKATLNIGPIVREAGALCQVMGNAAATGRLGTYEFIKTTGATSAFVHNGYWDPWLIAYGENDNVLNSDFVRYDAENGFVPATDLYTDNTLTTTDAKPIANLTGNQTISENTSVKGLRIVNTDTSGSGTLTINSGVTLTVGDGTNPAGVLLNYSNKSGSGYYIKGSGTLAFGDSEAIIWCSVRNDDGRRYLYITAPITANKGITFASPIYTVGASMRGPIIDATSTAVQNVKGDLRIRGCRYNVNSGNLPFPNIYLDGSGSTRSAQLCAGNYTITNKIFASGNGFANSSDWPGVLNGNGTYTAEVTLTGDATFLGCPTFNAPIKGAGDLVLQASSTVSGPTLAAANTYVGDTYLRQFTKDSTYPGLLTLTANGTFGTGTVHNEDAATIRFVGGTKTIPNKITGTGAIEVSENASLTFTGAVDASSLLVKNGSTIAVKNLTVAQLTGGGTITAADDDSTLVIDTDEDYALSVKLSGALKVIKRGSGTLTLLPDNNDFTGGLVIEEGKVTQADSITEPFASGRVFWLDGSDSSTMTLGENNEVSEWRDKSGNGFKFGVYGSYGNPTLAASSLINSNLSAVDFNKGPRLLANKSATYRTLVFVVQTRSFLNSGGFFGRAYYDRCGIRTVDYDKSTVETWSFSKNNAHFTDQGGYTINGVDKQYRLDYNNSQLVVAIRAGSSASSDAPITFQAGLGGYTSHSGTSTRYWDGQIGEMIAYDHVLSAAELKLLQNYLSQKWQDKTYYTNIGTCFSAGSTVTLTGDGLLDLAGVSASVGGLAGTGKIITTGGAATLTTGVATDFRGNLTGAVALATTGDGVSPYLKLTDGASVAVTGGSATLNPYAFQMPTDGLVWWIDAADASTITTNENGGVTKWASKGGASVYFKQEGTRAVPVYLPADAEGSLDGNKPAVYFRGRVKDDTTEQLYNIRLVNNQNSSLRTTFIVFRAILQSQTKSCDGFFGYCNIDSGYRYVEHSNPYGWNTPYGSKPTTWVNGVVKSHLNSQSTITLTDMPFEETHVLVGRVAPGDTVRNTTYVFGSYPPSGKDNRCFNGYICESVAYNRELSDAEMKLINDYLIAKWRRTGALDPAETSLGGTVSVANGASATVPEGTTVQANGAGTITGNVTLADPYIVTPTNDKVVPCLTVTGTATIPSNATLQLNNARYLPAGWQTFISATTLSGSFATMDVPEAVDGMRYKHRETETTAQLRKSGFFILFQSAASANGN